jgi:predicted CopG family antitoxin
MKNVNPTFTEEEYENLKRIKDEYNESWHDLIIYAIEKLEKLEV